VTSGGNHQPILSVRNLEVTFGTQEGEVKAVQGVSFDVFQ